MKRTTGNYRLARDAGFVREGLLPATATDIDDIIELVFDLFDLFDLIIDVFRNFGNYLSGI